MRPTVLSARSAAPLVSVILCTHGSRWSDATRGELIHAVDQVCGTAERITVPHYLAPGTAERARARRVQKVLGPAVSGEVPSKFAFPPAANAPDPSDTNDENDRDVA